MVFHVEHLILKLKSMKTILNRWVSGLSVMLLLGLGFALLSCEKEMDDSNKLDVVIPFYNNNNYNPELLSEDILRDYAMKNCVRHIYITVMSGEKFTNLTTNNITNCRNFLAKRMAISPKISGRGNFVFEPGDCAVEDSLALVEMGFTINQQDK